MGSPVSPIVANLYMEYLEQKALSTAPHPLGSGAGLWMTPLSSTRKPTSKASFNTSTVLTLALSSQWRTTRGMVPYSSWTPLSSQRLMAHYPSLYTGNLHILTSIYSGIVTITSQPNLVSSTPSPIGPKQCVASLSCSNRKRTTSGGLSLNASILNGLWTRWRKDSAGLPVRLLMGPATKAPQLPKVPPMESQPRVTLSYPTHKVFVKVSKRSVVDMASRPTSKVAGPSKTSWSPPRTKTLWSTKVVLYIGTSVATKFVMRNI